MILYFVTNDQKQRSGVVKEEVKERGRWKVR